MALIQVIALDSPTWNDLRDAYGPATQIPAILRRLEHDEAAIDELYDAFALTEHGAATDGALAVVPHIWRLALARADRYELLRFLGRVAFAANHPLEGSAPIAAAARADLAGADAEDVLDLVLAILALDHHPVTFDAVEAVKDETFEVRCPGDDCGVEILIHDDIAQVDDDTTPLIAGSLPDQAGDRGALGEIVRTLTNAGHDSTAARLAAIAARVECPVCGDTFAVLDELFEPTAF